QDQDDKDKEEVLKKKKINSKTQIKKNLKQEHLEKDGHSERKRKIKRKENPKDVIKEQLRQSLILNPQEVIQRGSRLYLIKQSVDESKEVWLQRVNYIIKTMKQRDLTIDEIIKMSFLFRNITVYKMTYPSSIMKKIC